MLHLADFGTEMTDCVRAFRLGLTYHVMIPIGEQVEEQVKMYFFVSVSRISSTGLQIQGTALILTFLALISLFFPSKEMHRSAKLLHTNGHTIAI